MEISDESARVYDPASGQVTTIPLRELSDAMIAIRIDGVEGVVYVDQAVVQIEKGPIRHESLSDDLVDRIGRIADIFDEVLPGTAEEWVDDFRRDDDPESELVVWERIAAGYLRGVDPFESIDRKRDVLTVLLSCANNSPQVAALTAECETLDRDEVHAICEDWMRDE